MFMSKIMEIINNCLDHNPNNVSTNDIRYYKICSNNSQKVVCLRYLSQNFKLIMFSVISAVTQLISKNIEN